MRLVSCSTLSSSSKLLTTKMSDIEKTVFDIVGFEFNLSSPKQVGEVIFDKLRIIENAKKTKTGQYSTSEEVLESLRGKHEVIDYILEYRGIKKLLSTYIDSLPLLLNSKTHKLHTSFNQCITSTGRLSSSNPNLQNIPIRTEEGRLIRKAFIPEDDSCILSSDYSQIELRLFASFANAENLIEAFIHGADIHAKTASDIFGIPIDKVDKDMRRTAKAVNFGILYGISSFGLSEDLGIDIGTAKKFIDNYLETYPGIKEYMEKENAPVKKEEVKPVKKASSKTVAKSLWYEKIRFRLRLSYCLRYPYFSSMENAFEMVLNDSFIFFLQTKHLSRPRS